MDNFERNRDFKGVWIPKEIWLNENLTTLEKIILIEVDSLDNEEHCVAGNEYLAQFCQCSEWKVSTAIKKLQELGYIEVIAFDGRHRRIRSCLKNFQGQTLENPKADSGKPKAININNNINNNNTIYNSETSSLDENKSSPKEIFSETSVTVINSPAPAPQGQKPKRVSLKDQLVNYVNELDYSEETKQSLLRWIFQIGLNGKVSVEQLRNKLEYIWNIYSDESSVRESIDEAYRNNWFGFFPLKKKPQNSPATLEKKASNSLVKSPRDNNYTEKENPQFKTYKKGGWDMTEMY